MADRYQKIGEILASARREKGKSLKDAEENTKIMAHNLEAVEAGQPDKLPSREYFMLFARSYAQYLGLDPAEFDEIEDDDVVEKTAGAPGSKAPEGNGESTTAEISPEVQEKKFGKTVLYLVIGIVVLFVAFLVFTQLFMKPTSRSSEGEPLEASGSPPASEGGPSADEAGFTIPDEPYQPPEKLRMHMVAKQDVWALVVRDGDTVLNRKLLGGEQRRWEADYRYKLTLGISTAVDLYLNDQKLAPLTDQARIISGLEINQVNYRQFLPQAVDSTRLTRAEPVSPKTVNPPVEKEEDSWIEHRPETATQESTIVGDTPAIAAPRSQEDDSWIERRPDTVTQESTTVDTPATATPRPQEDDSWIERPPDTAKTETPDGN